MVHGNHDVFTTMGYKITLISTGLAFLLLIIIIHEERYRPLYRINHKSGRVKSAEHRASLYSKFMFCYVDPMLKIGYRHTLNDQDLHELLPENQTKHVLINYRMHKRLKMAASLFNAFRKPLIIQFFYCLTWSLAMFGPPFALNKIIKYIENPSASSSDGSGSLTPYFYVLSMFIAACIQSLSYQQGLYIGRTLGIRMQSIVIGEVYGKALRRRQQDHTLAMDKAGGEDTRPSASENTNKQQGNINNLLSVDATKMGDLTAYIFYLYCFPVQIGVSIYGLYRLLGTAALYGVVIMVLSQPIIYKLSNKFQGLHHTVMGFTDKRMKLMNELLGAIRIVKFFAWENEFRQRVKEAREVELKAIRARLFMFMWMGNVWFLIPVIIMVTVFYVYTLSEPLTASTAFTALALFNTFKQALDDLPFVTSFLLQAYVSMKRVEKFLEEDEVEPAPSSVSLEHKATIGFINNASFTWGNKSSPPVLRDLNLMFPLRKLSVICGGTGSGKTSLLASLLGETTVLHGSAVLPRKLPSLSLGTGGAVSGIAYVAQTAWLQNCSIRDNILFGLPYDQERYEKILFMAALTKDLDILEYGDQTEIGERGITLSGGQKQRVAIARAVYSQAEIVILDDCLSAVDAHTAKHLYEHCITSEFLQDRTVILVTHHVNLCIKGAEYVVALKDGKVVTQGKPQDVIATGVLGDEVVLSDDDDETLTTTTAGLSEASSRTLTKKKKGSDSPNKGNKDNGGGSTSKTNGGTGGKLTQEEARAEGSVSWKVYAVYFYASGGFPFWIAVLLLFALTQGAIMSQDYWLKIWATASTPTPTISDGSSNATSFRTFSLVNVFQQGEYNGGSIGSMIPFGAHHSYNSGSLASYDETNNGSSNVANYLGIYFLLGLLALVMTTLRSLILFTGSLRASRRIHQQLLDSVLRAKVRFFDTTPMGRIINRFSTDLETIDQALAPSMSSLLYACMAASCVVILISTIIPIFLIPGSIIAVLFWVIGSYYLKSSREMKRLNSVSRSPIYIHFQESASSSGVATIRAFGCQRRFIEENYEKIDNNNRPFIWMWGANRWLHCRIDILGAFIGFVTGVGLLISRSSIDAGLAGLALSYSLTVTRHFIWIVRQYAMYEMNCNSIERVQEYLDVEQEPPEQIDATRPSIHWPETGSVKVDQLVMKYSSEAPPVLHGISFETRPREKVGIVGRTGSGKSTLALSLFRFMEATSGSITIDGIDISQLGLHDLRSQLNIIPQDPVLFSGTLRSNLDPFHEFTDADLYAALKRAHLIHDGNYDQITLDNPVAENGSNWSQGQRQLIALARALVKKSSLIVLDEATSSVDFDTDHKIQQTIRTEFADSSLLCIAHRIRTVADYDRILVLDQGRVVEFDTPYNLMTREDSLFHQMCERSGEFSELLAIASQAHHQQ
ncbi:P-loop containing nucleoside triphosphate hydrolase protein [Phascolomyces articulosus]|uniref:P-loop containing nucleoside triphosphate hydrolase protein n=1 Tax=Phascolomyces articulosus TaxID=60185 RepID=A0AAD5PF36_9FUNG|nr:P-loop containing nucleoside triphosphate hydrolase protein [Phascolomyces articulosus]